MTVDRKRLRELSADRDTARRDALLAAAQIALDMFEASGKTPAKCGCGQCIAGLAQTRR